MTGLFLTLLTTLLAGFGARDQVLVAQLAERQGARPSLLLVAVASGGLAAALAAFGGAQVAGLMVAPARLLLVAIAVGLAGLELLAMRPRTAAVEPTHSLGAFALVIFAIQLTDAARFMVFALAALTQAPLTSAMGGAIGAAAVVAAGWMIAAPLQAARLPALRRGLGGLLLLVALGLAAKAVGWA